MESTSTEGRILAVLEDDAKASYAEIADRAGVDSMASGFPRGEKYLANPKTVLRHAEAGVEASADGR